MEKLSGEALRRAEAAAGDYHPSGRDDAHVSDGVLLARAVELLRTRGAEAAPGEAFGLLACARLLDEVHRSRLRGEVVGPGVAATATEIARQVLDPEAP